MSYLFDSFFTFLLNFLSFLFTNRCSFFWELIPYHYAFFFLMGAAPLPLRLRSSPASQPRATSPAYSVAQPGAGPLPPAGTCEAPRLSAAPGVLRRSEDQQISTHGRPGERWREGRAGWEGPGCNPAMFFIFHVFLKTCGCL